MLPPWSENGYKEDGMSILEVHSDTTWSKGHKSEHSKFRLDIGKVAKSCNSLSRETVEPLFLGEFETELNTTLGNLFSTDLLWALVGPSDLQRSFPTKINPWFHDCIMLYIHIFSLAFSYWSACTKLTEQVDLSYLSSVYSYFSLLGYKVLCNFGTNTVMQHSNRDLFKITVSIQARMCNGSHITKPKC